MNFLIVLWTTSINGPWVNFYFTTKYKGMKNKIKGYSEKNANA